MSILFDINKDYYNEALTRLGYQGKIKYIKEVDTEDSKINYTISYNMTMKGKRNVRNKNRCKNKKN